MRQACIAAHVSRSAAPAHVPCLRMLSRRCEAITDATTWPPYCDRAHFDESGPTELRGGRTRHWRATQAAIAYHMAHRHVVRDAACRRWLMGWLSCSPLDHAFATNAHGVSASLHVTATAAPTSQDRRHIDITAASVKVAHPPHVRAFTSALMAESSIAAFAILSVATSSGGSGAAGTTKLPLLQQQGVSLERPNTLVVLSATPFIDRRLANRAIAAQNEGAEALPTRARAGGALGCLL